MGGSLEGKIHGWKFPSAYRVLLFEFSSIENSPKDLYARMVQRFKVRAARRAA